MTVTTETPLLKIQGLWIRIITRVLHICRVLIFCWPCISIYEYLFININQLDAL